MPTKGQTMLTEYVTGLCQPSNNTKKIKAIYPAQCSCGHLFLEKYQFSEVTEEGNIGFCWCGFCRTRVFVRPIEAIAPN